MLGALTVGGVALGLDSKGLATLKLDKPGSLLDLVATATDAAGNTGNVTDTLLVIDPTVTGAQGLSIASLPDGRLSPDRRTSLARSAAAISRATRSTSTRATATSPRTSGAERPGQPGVLGTIDPTLLANDVYDLRLTATNTGGITSTIDQSVSRRRSQAR